MARQSKFAALTFGSVLLSAAIAGCERQTAQPAASVAPASNVSMQAQAPEDASSSHQSHAGANEAKTAKDTMQISSPTSGTQQAGANAGGGLPSGSADGASGAASPKIDAKDAYKEENPTLLGLSLKQPLNDVLAKLGKAKTNYVMDDETDPVMVYEYDGFSIGFNKADALEFVDVQNAEVDPGLHGLRVGQKSEDAFKSLGKPDTNSTYVLTYKSKGTILKLDLDPKTGTIRSIKLFASK